MQINEIIKANRQWPILSSKYIHLPAKKKEIFNKRQEEGKREDATATTTKKKCMNKSL